MLRNSQIIILGLCIAVATIVSSVIFSQGFLKVMKFAQERITVTGSAEREIRSDYVVWKGSVSAQEAELPSAYKRLGGDLEKIRRYLAAQGMDEKEIVASQIVTEKIYRKSEEGKETNDIQWYRLSQDIEVRSREVEKVTRVSRESTALINDNVEFESRAPEYFYTRLDDLKVEMLARAVEDAKERAASMVRATGNKIGFMRSARMGVFQITPIHSTEVSDWGINDTSSLEKKVRAVVTVSFSIE